MSCELKIDFKPLAFPARLAVLMMCLLTGTLQAQQTVLYKDAQTDYTNLLKEYDQGLYGRCIVSATKFLDTYHDPAYEQIRLETELYRLKSGLRIQSPGIISEILAFSDRHKPGTLSQQALVLVGEDAYDRNQFDNAILYFSQVDGRALSPDERSSVYFKLGYCLFVRKEFEQAGSIFKETRDVRNKYYYPSNYYYGMTQYFTGHYDEAIRSFERVSASDFYKDYIPYYITQIHFNNKDYQKVTGYGNQALNNPSVLNKSEIRHLIGQAYFETGDYLSAIPHLEYVEQHSSKLRTDDFYQLGMAYYHTGRYTEAIPILAEIRNETGVKAHYANYYLGQCYLKTGDKVSARNSLMNASRMQGVPSLAVEATFHYGRLCAEAGDDVEAIRVLQTIPSSSAHFQEAQTTLASILTNTSDYTLAIRELEAMPSLTPPLKEAYQKVSLYRAEQMIQENKTEEAIFLLDQSLRYPMDRAIEARAYFWKGELAHHRTDYTESIKWFKQYFSIPVATGSLPVQQSLPLAQYNQGYNYLRSNDYVEAQKLFEAAVTGISSLPLTGVQANTIKQQVYPDAVLRAGDCAFKRGQYEKANQYYDQSIQKKFPGNDYAEYQKAIIKGLQKQPREKIRLMEELASDMPGSAWADDALYQAGITYQEENQMAKAIQTYEKLVNQHGQKSSLLLPALLRLGLLSYNLGQHEASLNHYKSIFQYNPDPETAREAMAAIQEIYVNELDKPDAYFAFAASIPGYSVTGSQKDSIVYAAAENHYATGHYEKAVEAFQKYILDNPKGVYALKARYLKAESLSLLRKYNDALPAYESVLKEGQSGYYASSLYKAALIAYNHKQDMEQAFTYFSMYIPMADSDEREFEALLGALRAAYRLKRTDDVYTIATKVMDHSRATDDLRALAHYYIATTAYQNLDFEKATTSFNAVIRINSAELAAESRYYIASVYAEKGEREIAGKLAEEAAKANVGYPFWVAKSLILLSDIQFDMGALLNARAIMEAILENFQGDDAIMKEAKDKLEKIRIEEEARSRIKPPAGDTLEMQHHPKKE